MMYERQLPRFLTLTPVDFYKLENFMRRMNPIFHLRGKVIAREGVSAYENLISQFGGKMREESFLGRVFFYFLHVVPKLNSHIASLNYLIATHLVQSLTASNILDGK